MQVTPNILQKYQSPSEQLKYNQPQLLNPAIKSDLRDLVRERELIKQQELIRQQELLREQQALKEMLKAMTITTSKVITSRAPRTARTQRTIIRGELVDLGEEKGKKKKVKGLKEKISSFFVATKTRGEEKVISPFGLTRGEALSLGKRYTKSKAEATLRLIPSKTAPRTLGLKPITEKQLFAAGYRVPLKGGKPQFGKDTFIQLKTARITTPGEKREISAKGAAARRKTQWWY